MTESFLWLSERAGWKHLYHYTADGSLIRQVTNGPWEVRTLHGVLEGADGDDWIYFSGTERSHIGNDVYRVTLDGSNLTQLSTAPGTHRASFNPAFTRYIDTWSDATTPPQTRLHRADGRELRVIDANQVKVLSEYRLSRAEFVQVETRDGFVMEAVMIKPPDFDPSRRYPRLPAHVRWTTHPASAQRLGRYHVHVPSDACPEGDHHMDLRQPHRERQGRGVDVAGLSPTLASWSCATSKTGSTG